MKHAFLLGIALLAGCAVSGQNFGAGDGGDTSDAAVSADGSPSSDGAAGNDASPSGDAGVDATTPSSRISCGGGYCRADQQCASGACVTACQGTNVPGDYASISAALSALGQAGVDATICLAAQTYSESPSASYSTGKSLTILGPAAARISSLDVGGGYSKVTLEGFAVGQLTLSSSAPVDVVGVRSEYTSVGSSQTGTLLLDGCNLGIQGQSYALYVDRYYASQPANVTVQNSWIHAASYGVYLYGYASSGQTSLGLLNDTIVDTDTGISVTGGSASISLTYANDIIANNTSVGVNLSNVSSVTHASNLLWGNGSNYAGTAVDGTGYVKADPMLDTDAPPGPKAGSPARGAADSSHAPSTDYWDSSRGKKPDIGAVQGS
jgi:hypothetical protein